MDCLNKKKNSDFCTCTYAVCSRKGICCECVRYHLSQDELPGCFFPPEAERTYNRSKQYYCAVWQGK